MNAVDYNALRPFSASMWASIQSAVGASADGIPGPKTADAIRRFQRRHRSKLEPDRRARFGSADGKIGYKTAKALGLDPASLWGFEVQAERHAGRELGIDVSFRQKRVRWGEVLDAGVRFAWLRCSQWREVPGRPRDFIDSTYAANSHACGALQLPWGAYHVVQISRDEAWSSPREEAAQIWRALGDVAPPWGVALDLEQSILRQVRKTRSARWVSSWLVELVGLVEAQGHETCLYVSAPGQRYLEPRAALVDRSRWIVDYQARGATWLDEPGLATGWGESPWEWRQVCETGRVPGIDHKCDLNIMRS
jgi:GH25 family lysozyme M1 (1,4-beta-N-acetylmuramidase)